MAPRNFVYGLCLIAALASRFLVAETVVPSTELPLDAASVVIELYNADVEVLSDPTAAPILRARLTGDEPEPARLDHQVNGGVLEIRRPTGADADPFRMKVEIVGGAEQDVHIKGRDLRIMAGESQQTGVTAPPGLRFSLESSHLDMEGGRDSVLEVSRTSVWLARTRGLLTLTLASGTAEVREHQGSLKLETTGAEVTLVDFQGELEPRLNGGSLDVRGGAGRAAGAATDAVVLFDGWRGPLSLTGTGTTLEARGTDDRRPWRLAGQDLQVTLDALAAPVTAELDGGHFLARTMAGKMVVAATNRADVEMADLAEDVVLGLSEGATARIDGVAGTLQAQVSDATMRADGIHRLDLTGARSEIHAGRVEGLGRFEMSDSEIDLDLTPAERGASLKLLGTGRTRVQLPTPCRVRIDGSQAPAGDRIEVTGCELRMPGQPAASSHGRLIYGDRHPVTLTVDLGEDVELTVEGRP